MARRLVTVLLLLVILVQTAIAVTEICFWESPVVHGRLDYTPEVAHQVAPIVANAGLYNGFLGAGLIWGLCSGVRSYQIENFFLICVIVAGIFGAVTLRPTTLLLQSAPAGLALLAVWLSRKPAEPRD
jgi:putative membrane protein